MEKIKDLPLLERPREKAIRYGIQSLATEEILALLINSGGPQNSALNIAQRMLNDSHGLFRLANKSFEEFKNYKGIKEAKALNLCAIFELAKRYQEREIEEDERLVDSYYLYRKYSSRLLSLEQETIILVILDHRKRVVHEIILYKGDKERIIIRYREIFKQIILHNGYYFYVIHNHPSGHVEPSEQDIKFTNELTQRCDKIGLVLLDHLIMGLDGCYSFFENRKIA